MSHSQHDRSGGHMATFIDVGDVTSNTRGFRRFAKRFHRREARRESRRIVATAFAEMEEDFAEAQRELMLLDMDLFYDMECGCDDCLGELDQPEDGYDFGPDYGWADDWEDFYY